jgi:hypothetical protein
MDYRLDPPDTDEGCACGQLFECQDCIDAAHRTDLCIDDHCQVCKRQYPIFFNMHGSIVDGFPNRWFWFDPGLSHDDQGPFPTREDAATDWGIVALSHALATSSEALNEALNRLGPLPDPDLLISQLGRLDLSLEGPAAAVNELGRLADRGMTLMAEMGGR